VSAQLVKVGQATASSRMLQCYAVAAVELQLIHLMQPQRACLKVQYSSGWWCVSSVVVCRDRTLMEVQQLLKITTIRKSSWYIACSWSQQKVVHIACVSDFWLQQVYKL
jgi:hypothetical protein